MGSVLLTTKTIKIFLCDTWQDSQEELKEGENEQQIVTAVNPLYLANLANLTFSLIFKDAKLKRRQQYFSTLK